MSQISTAFLTILSIHCLQLISLILTICTEILPQLLTSIPKIIVFVY